MAAAAYLWPLLALLAFAVTLGLQKGWAASFAQLFYWLAAQIDKLPSVTVVGHTLGFGGIAHAIRAASDSVYNWLGQAVQHTGAPFVTFVRYMATVFEAPAQQVALMAADLLHTLTLLRHQVIPRMIAAKVAWIPRHLAHLAAQVAALTARAPVHIVKQIEHTLAPVTKITIHKAIAIPLPRIGRLERAAELEAKRVNKLAKRIAPAALAALIAAQIAKLGAGWIRCSKMKKYGRNVCGMDQSLLDSLLADTLLIVGTISLVEFAEGLQDGMNGLVPQVRKFWGVK